MDVCHEHSTKSRGEFAIRVAIGDRCPQPRQMFSHVVIFWAKPEKSFTAQGLVEGAEKYLRPIPGVLHFHVGLMVPSPRPVVDQSYQVALNIVFTDKKAQDDYQVHPLHLEFLEKVFKPLCWKAVVYDFE